MKSAVFVRLVFLVVTDLRLAQIDMAEQQTIAQRCPHYLLTPLSVIQSFRYRTFL
jgi:hypothetical protein